MNASLRVRPAAVAGTFYPADPAGLRESLASAFADARSDDGPPPKALIAPHAGYVYSGPVAASAYRTLEGRTGIERVVVLGPSHFVPFRGLAVTEAGAFATPLGEVRVDRGGCEVAASAEAVRRSDVPHGPEHSLEVHLPFLQTVLGDVGIVPLVVGDAGPREVADVLGPLWDDGTLVVVSSDLSHYLDYETAVAVDRRTADAIVALDAAAVGDRDACGSRPIRGLLVAAREREMAARLLDLRNSGDTAGDRSRVVGYGAFAFA